MKTFKKKIYFFLFISLSICLGTFSWKVINLPLLNNDIIGYYSLNKANPLNDIFGYLIFITIPVLFYFIWNLVFKKKKINQFFYNIKFKDENINFDKNIYILFLFFIFFIILELLSVKFLISEIDLFHEGERLSAAFKSKLDGSLWSGSYISKGVIYEILGPKYIWKFFNQESVGLLRFLDLLYVFIAKFILICLSLEISKNINFNSFLKKIFFVFLTIIFLSCISYSSSYNNGISANLIKFREIPILLTLLFFIKSLKNLEQLYTQYILIGFLTVATFFWSIDRAIVLNLLVLFIIIFLIINKSYKNIITIILSAIFFWLFFYFFLKEEFIFFITNTIGILKEMTKINGLIHPIPFSDDPNASRSTKTILSIVISLLISFSFFFKEKSILPYRFKILLTVISLVSFLSYIYALGRTDYTHLKQAFGFPIIFFSCYLLFYLFHYIHHKYIFNNSYKKNFLILITPLVLLFFTTFNIDYKNIINFKSRFIKYVELKDNNFLSKADNNFIIQASTLIKDEQCIQLYSNDAALLYFLKIPNCTKYYYVWIIGSKKNQIDLINKLGDTNFIIKNGTIDESMSLHNWGIPLDIKYPLLADYIYKNFNKEIVIGNRKFLSR
tara:strand:+ start:3190 stop:5034 length:1845 start_codon:yes stop_codon:yes gene_type:complete